MKTTIKNNTEYKSELRGVGISPKIFLYRNSFREISFLSNWIEMRLSILAKIPEIKYKKSAFKLKIEKKDLIKLILWIFLISKKYINVIKYIQAIPEVKRVYELVQRFLFIGKMKFKSNPSMIHTIPIAKSV